MSLFPTWLRGWLKGRSPSPQTDHDQDPTADALEQARALARDGQLHAAAHAYSKLTRKQRAPAILLEHANVLLAMGDSYGAAGISTRVLAIEPQNSGALAIRRQVLALDMVDESKKH